MTRAKRPRDWKARERALVTDQSFIVQAPAGSGKTELLVRRYLALLAIVEAPEQILAITFTRKATAEMRQRIIDALADDENFDKSDENAVKIAEIAANARKNAAKREWNLAANTRRLRIQTIDAFCNEVVWRMPWSARFGAPPALVEDPAPLYAQAATRALDHLERGDAWSDAADALLALVDANWGRARDLLAATLANRDRWMRDLSGGIGAGGGGAGDGGDGAGDGGGGDGDDARARIEAMWRAEIGRELQSARAAFDAFSPAARAEWAALGAYAAGNLAADANSPLPALRELTEFPPGDHNAIDAWHALAALALTKSGALRKKLTKNDGFPVGDDGQKSRMLELLEAARAQPAIGAALDAVRHLPRGQFDDAQWRSVAALVQLLRLAAAELRLLFKERNQADYIELTQRAALALGDADAPTDLALAFDCELQHILMDEFQDTSTAHLELLEKLTAGWQGGDARTLFLVGDPMQSIYRFREAEVGNFLSVAAEQRVGDIRLESLQLTANFRSRPALVDWFNATFEAALPAQDDAAAGAVKYARAEACVAADGGGAFVHAAVADSMPATPAAAMEAESIADLIAATQTEFPAESVAVLGRTRRHLTAVAAALRRRGIGFCGRDLERLGERQAIRDLIALTRALVQPADRVAMLSLLRAPFCGLKLADLSALVESAGAADTLPALWRSAARLAEMSADGRVRLARLTAVVDAALARRGRVALRDNVEAAWLALGGPATVDAADLDDCARYLALLADLESAAADITPAALRAATADLWAQAGADAKVELLTIHKAKGLEFEHVILPRLDGGARALDAALLRWRKQPQQLLIAPLPSPGDGGGDGNSADPFYRYLARLEKQHDAFERGRLLYVACTRARCRLHLFGRAARKDGESPSAPPADSLLALLWPQVAAEFERAVGVGDGDGDDAAAADDAGDGDAAAADAGDGGDGVAAEEISPPPLQRLPTNWRLPALPPGVSAGAAGPAAGAEEQLEFSWAGETARITGTVIHQILQGVDAVGWEAWRRTVAGGGAQTASWRNQLLENGLAERHLDAALAQIAAAIDNARDDPRAAWIFSAAHRDIRVEWPLTGVLDGGFKHVVIDRSFVDQSGARWVIDFKSSRHEGGDTDAFLDRERIRHQPQMAAYAQVVSALHPGEVKSGLYFPALRGWREW
ncbi:MAG: UvrD-helicase domain-containing protein [Gammaproteobacteria bacterium]|nr:UvrD-helicase domain-containing protein [Gammaproteobacteria bacterium]